MKGNWPDSESPRLMKQPWRTVVAILLLLGIAFCIYGFMAAFEPGGAAARVVYAIAAVVLAAAFGWGIFRRR
jgi:hypothetical protein